MTNRERALAIVIAVLAIGLPLASAYGYRVGIRSMADICKMIGIGVVL